jgi:hypothetical protein
MLFPLDRIYISGGAPHGKLGLYKHGGPIIKGCMLTDPAVAISNFSDAAMRHAETVFLLPDGAHVNLIVPQQTGLRRTDSLAARTATVLAFLCRVYAQSGSIRALGECNAIKRWGFGPWRVDFGLPSLVCFRWKIQPRAMAAFRATRV